MCGLNKEQMTQPWDYNQVGGVWVEQRADDTALGLQSGGWGVISIRRR